MRAMAKRLLPTLVVLLASCLLLALLGRFRMKDHASEVERDRFATESSFVVGGDEDVYLEDLGPFATAVAESEGGVWLYEANNYLVTSLPYHNGSGLSGAGSEALVGADRASEVRDGSFYWGGVSYRVVGTLGEKDDSLLSGSVVLSAPGLLDGISASDLRFDGFGARAALALAYPDAVAQSLDQALSSKTDKQAVIRLFTLSSLLIAGLGVALAVLWYARRVRDEYRVMLLLGKQTRVVARGVLEFAVVFVLAAAIGAVAFLVGVR